MEVNKLQLNFSGAENNAAKNMARNNMTKNVTNTQNVKAVSGVSKEAKLDNDNKGNKGTGYDEKVDKLLNEVNEKFKIANREFQYKVHEKTNRFIVSVKDTESGKVIREIPSEESLDFFAKMLEMAGLLVDEKS